MWAWAFVPGMSQPDTPFQVLGVDLSPQAILPWVPLIFSVEPYLIGAAYLVPTDTLLSYIVFMLIIWFILPPIFTAAGIWDPYAGGHDAYWIFRTLNRSNTGPIGLANWAEFFRATWVYFGIGAMLGLIVWPMIVHRGEVVHYIKSIFKAAPEDFEEREPMRVRNTVLLLILTSLVWGVCIIIGSGFVAAKYFYMVIIINFFGILWMGVCTARVTAEFGQPQAAWSCHVKSHNLYQPFGMWFYHSPDSPWYIPSDRMHERIMLNLTTFSGGIYGGGYSGLTPSLTTPWILEAYKIGDLTGTRAKDQFKGVLIAIPIAVVLTLVTFLYMIHSFGAAETLKYGMLGWPTNIATRYNFYTEAYDGRWFIILEPKPTMYVGMIIGALITITLFILRARFPGFPLAPTGVPLAFSWMSIGMFFPCIIAYVAKYLTVRVGGIEAYNEKGVPFAVGLIAALNIMSVVLSLRNAYVAFTFG